MARISFKTKIKNVYNMDGSLAYQVIEVPKLTKAHCDMAEFRRHKIYAGLANSDLFPNVLARIRKDVLKGKESIRLDRIPEAVSIDTSGFLAVVTIDV